MNQFNLEVGIVPVSKYFASVFLVQHACNVNRKLKMSKEDPKVFFSNERTFLKWLHTSVTIGSIASALLGFSGLAAEASDHPGFDAVKIVGLLLLLVAILFCAYAIVTFRKRNQLLMLKAGSGYGESFGPVALGVVLVLALCAVYAVYITKNSAIHL
mmetsp:Transcript_6650/g.8703  ORF Transcript_6650/g.8703 Transcript_6650/m.8703 type:complete len:157 (+) Transcript_6650:3-473(+)